MAVPKPQIKNLIPTGLILIAAVSGLVCVFALRANYSHMAHLRDQVYTADAQNGDVKGSLQSLQSYVTRHMNTSLTTGNTSVYPPVQLAHTYDRLVQARAAELQKTNAQLYTDAQHYCEQQNSADFSGRNRVPCIEQYVQNHGVKLQPIADSLYKFDFVSPRWSPDLAGWSMVLAVVSLIAGVSALVFRRLKA